MFVTNLTAFFSSRRLDLVLRSVNGRCFGELHRCELVGDAAHGLLTGRCLGDEVHAVRFLSNGGD
jgi:hypothetical protein